MTRCGRCAYGLVNDRCPMCAGRRPVGVPLEQPKAAAVPSPLPLYWVPLTKAAA